MYTISEIMFRYNASLLDIIYNLYLLFSFPVNNSRRVSVLTKVACLTVAEHKGSLVHLIRAFQFAVPRL